ICKLSCINNIQFCCVNSVDEIFFFCFPSRSKPQILFILQAAHIRLNSDLTVLSPLVRKLLPPLFSFISPITTSTLCFRIRYLSLASGVFIFSLMALSSTSSVYALICRLPYILLVHLHRSLQPMHPSPDKRNKYEEVKHQHENYPIDYEVIWKLI